MSKIVRKPQKIFGSTAGLNQIAEFGSLANSTPAFTTDPTVIQSLTQYLDGWFSAVIGNNSPAIEDMNALCYLFAYQLAYILQEGVAEWDSQTTYYIGSLASNGTGVIYKSLTDSNLNNVLTDGTNWDSLALVTQNAAANRTIPGDGTTTFQANPTVPSGKTWTIASGGYLSVMGPMTISGTVVNNGTMRII